MKRKISLIILTGLLGLLCYFAVWSVKYSFPPGPAAIIDLRKSPCDLPRCVTFCSSLADNPLGFPGHAYVVWSPSMDVNLEKDHSLGYMPRNFHDQVPSLFVSVPGVLLDHVSGNMRNLDKLTVIVSESDYLRSERLAQEWHTESFKVGNHDCAAFVKYVASLLDLNTGNSAYVFPQDYLRQLKQLNNRVKLRSRLA